MRSGKRGFELKGFLVRARLLGLSLGCVALGAGGVAAYGQTVVGNPSEANQQGNTGSQVAVQSGNCSYPICGSTKTEANAITNGSASGQNIAPGTAAAGGILVGNSGQTSTQGNATIQSATGAKTETNTEVGAQLNNQNVAGGAAGNSVIVGTPMQLSFQGSNAQQGAKESSGGAGTIIKGPTQTIMQTQANTSTSCQSAATGGAICM
jgi:hypothetical protein